MFVSQHLKAEKNIHKSLRKSKGNYRANDKILKPQEPPTCSLTGFSTGFTWIEKNIYTRKESQSSAN